MTQYSEDELIKFLDYVSKKGIMNESTVVARKIAVQKVLSVLEPSEKTDLRQLNRDQLFTRFLNKYGKDFTPGSLTTYRQRFSSALDDFIKYVNDPAGFKPAGTARGPRQTSAGASSTRRVIAAEGHASGRSHAQAVSAQDLFAYPISLSGGRIAQLYLPPTITHADADRVSTVVAGIVKALAVEEKEVPQEA